MDKFKFFNRRKKSMFLRLSNNTIRYLGTQYGYQEIFEGNLVLVVSKDKLESMIRNNENVSNVCTTLITNMSGLFFNNTIFNQNISTWDVSNVTLMKNMFFNAESFNQPLNNWDVSNVTNMQAMFRDAKSFNQPIGNWDVSNTLNLIAMFRFISYNQDLSNWCVEHINSTPGNFGGAFSPGFGPQWGQSC